VSSASTSLTSTTPLCVWSTRRSFSSAATLALWAKKVCQCSSMLLPPSCLQRFPCSKFKKYHRQLRIMQNIGSTTSATKPAIAPLTTQTCFFYAHRACSTNHAPTSRTPSPRRFLKVLACVSNAQLPVISTITRHSCGAALTSSGALAAK